MNTLLKTRKMLRHDWSAGLRQSMGIYALTVIYILSVCAVFDHQFSEWEQMQGVAGRPPAVWDYLAFLFEGMEPFDFKMQNGFRLPAIWMMTFLLFLLSIAKYPRSDMYGIGQQLLLKSKSRTAWWLSKTVWTILAAIVYYTVCFAVLLLYLAFTHGVSWQPSDITLTVLPGFGELSLLEQVLWLVAVPVVTLCTLGLFELVFCILYSAVVGVIAAVSALLAALYFNLGALPGGTCILLRSCLGISGGFSLGACLTIAAATSVLYAAVGCLLFYKLDLYGNHEV